jgi:hypothetical protein
VGRKVMNSITLVNDRELLELAAKAAGLDVENVADHGGLHVWFGKNPKSLRLWNPLTDDGDALRLAVTLRLSVKHGIEIGDDSQAISAYAYYGDVGECHFEPHNGDPHAATRRAIVRAAAAIGEAMQ